jgi:serpin B
MRRVNTKNRDEKSTGLSAIERANRMRIQGWHAAAFLFLLVGCSQRDDVSRPELAEVHEEIARKSNELGLQVFGKLNAADGNLVFSPYGLTLSLSMLLSGADGTTRDELLEALGSTAKLEADMHVAQGELRRWLIHDQSPPGDQLDAGSMIFIQRDTDVLRSFLVSLEREYDCKPLVVDFVNQPATARKVINDWVAETTHGNLADIITPDDISTETRLLLANVIYFKGDWQHAFERASTHKSPFRVSADKSVECDMMSELYRFAYTHQDNVRVLVMPYRGEALSMVVVLPDEVNGLSSVEQQLTIEKLEQWVVAAESHVEELPVSLPRFQVKNRHDLKPLLVALDVKTAFDPAKADLSRIDGLRRSSAAARRWLFLDRIWQQAMIDVNEEGTEAAAATVITKTETATARDSFIADHPFLFFIRENSTGLILFFGRLVDPTAG